MRSITYTEYKHETYQCEKCYGYGTNTVGKHEVVCGECHGIGCVGDKGTQVTMLPSTVESARRQEFRKRIAEIGLEAARKESHQKRREAIVSHYKATKRKKEYNERRLRS